MKSNQIYNSTWQYVEQTNYYPSEINVPLFMIGGWFDHNTDLMLDFFNGIKSQSPTTVRDKHKLLIGPWVHGGHGLASVGTDSQGELSFPEAQGWSDSLALRFFDYYLLDESNSWEQESTIRYFSVGDNRWKETSIFSNNTITYPPCDLSGCSYIQIPIAVKSVDADSSMYFCEYQYDPKNPSPTIGGATLRNDLLQGPYDQEIVESRSDVLSFTSMDLFECNSEPISILGNPIVHLFVSSDKTDTDFTVRLTDVYPDGRSILIGEGIQRMRFRNGFSASDTSSINPGEVYPIEIKLPYISYSFLSYHKIRIDVSSSNYPRFDCNLNNGSAMYVAGDSLVANNRVYNMDPISGIPSHIDFPFDNYCLGGIEASINNNLNAFIIDKTLYVSASSIGFENLNISIYDAKNSLVWTKTDQQIFSGETKMYNLYNLPNGLYFLKMFSKSNAIGNFKLLVH